MSCRHNFQAAVLTFGLPAMLCLPAAGVAQASAEATASAVYEALTCNCACEGPTAQALAQAAAKATGGGCGGVATALSGKQHSTPSWKKVVLRQLLRVSIA